MLPDTYPNLGISSVISLHLYMHSSSSIKSGTHDIAVSLLAVMTPTDKLQTCYVHVFFLYSSEVALLQFSDYCFVSHRQSFCLLSIVLSVLLRVMAFDSRYLGLVGYGA